MHQHLLGLFEIFVNKKKTSFDENILDINFLFIMHQLFIFNYVRPFFRDGFRKYLCESFQQVIDTLINLNDEQDFSWQAELLL